MSNNADQEIAQLKQQLRAATKQIALMASQIRQQTRLNKNLQSRIHTLEGQVQQLTNKLSRG
jgi:chromosome segregation ATPase